MPRRTHALILVVALPVLSLAEFPGEPIALRLTLTPPGTLYTTTFTAEPYGN